MGIIQEKTWENHTNLNLGFRTVTLSPLSPYILGPNLFAYKLGFCYDPSPSIWANDPNSALFFWQASLSLFFKLNVPRTCVISSGSDTPAPEGAPNRNAELTVNQ